MTHLLIKQASGACLKHELAQIKNKNYLRSITTQKAKINLLGTIVEP